MALSVVMVFSEIKLKFLKSLTKKVSNLKVGLDIQESNSFGPLVSSDHREKVMNYIELSSMKSIEKYKLLIYLDKIRKEFRNEKILIYMILYKLFMRKIVTLENIISI